MRKIHACIAAVILLLCACEKTEHVVSLPQLELTVVQYESLTPVAGAIVTLYDNMYEWKEKVEALDTLTTDDKGVVLFKDLQEQGYFFFVEKGDMNNYVDYASTVESLKHGEKAQLQVKIMSSVIEF